MSLVEVRVFATLREHIAGAINGVLDVRVQEGDAVGDVCDRIGVPREEVRLILVNSERADWETRVKSGDYIAVFPSIAGG